MAGTGVSTPITVRVRHGAVFPTSPPLQASARAGPAPAAPQANQTRGIDGGGLPPQGEGPEQQVGRLRCRVYWHAASPTRSRSSSTSGRRPFPVRETEARLRVLVPHALRGKWRADPREYELQGLRKKASPTYVSEVPAASAVEARPVPARRAVVPFSAPECGPSNLRASRRWRAGGRRRRGRRLRAIDAIILMTLRAIN